MRRVSPRHLLLVSLLAAVAAHTAPTSLAAAAAAATTTAPEDTRTSSSSSSSSSSAGPALALLLPPQQAAAEATDAAAAPAPAAPAAPAPAGLAPAPGPSGANAGGGTSTLTGYLCALVSIIFFGSNFVPVKRFETGDGMFFQWVLCCAIWCVGLVVYAIRGFPTFQPLAMLGGAIWATGNIMSVPIIKILGLSLGLLIWGQSNMLIGWATGYFGLFGIKSQADQTHNKPLNFIGVALAVVALSLYIFIKPPSAADSDDSDSDGGDRVPSELPGARNKATDRLLQHAKKQDYASMSSATPRLLGNQTYRPVDVEAVPSGLSAVDQGLMRGSIPSDDRGVAASSASVYASRGGGLTTNEEDLSNPIDRMSASNKRLLGIGMSVVSGLLYGSNFTPPQYVHDRGPDCFRLPDNTISPVMLNKPGCGDQQMLDYVFPHFTGIFLASTFYFLCYCALMKNRPRVYPEAILPAFVSGVMWATAESCWFVANSVLGFATAFPIITSGPGFVASMWGVCLFAEVKGKRNFLVLGAALIFTVSSGVCISLSHS